MIVTRTPLRVSFIGGGTDYPEFFNQISGCVFGAAINQYVYVSVMPLPIFADEKYRFTYRVTESVQEISKINHPVVRSVLNQIKTKKPLNIATMANLPGRSGLGSSSSFTVGLIKAISEINGEILTTKELAASAINIERNVLAEPGGYQDQYHASFGGLRAYNFEIDGTVNVSDLSSQENFSNILSSCLVLVPISGSRDSSYFAAKTRNSISEPKKFKLMSEMAQLAREIDIYLATSNDSPERKIESLAKVMNEGWAIKSSISEENRNEDVNDLINLCLQNGALAARLCGAGGSGFLLLISKPFLRDKLIESLYNFNAFAISISKSGSQTVLREQIAYSDLGVVE
jgi:D-glycero-alpha-D-manno-heptose-7-phosphate kinase